MVKIWFVREGSNPTRGEPQYDLPLEQCIEQLGLAKNQPRSGLDGPPRFDGAHTDPRDPRHVFALSAVSETVRPRNPDAPKAAQGESG